MQTMAQCSKPGDMKFMVAGPLANKKKIFDLGKKDRKVGMQLRCLEDTANLFSWFMLPEEKKEFEELLADYYSAVDFNGGKLNAEMDKIWFRSLREVQKAIFEFIKPKFPAILKWTGTDSAMLYFNKCSTGGDLAA